MRFFLKSPLSKKNLAKIWEEYEYYTKEIKDNPNNIHGMDFNIAYRCVGDLLNYLKFLKEVTLTILIII